MPDSLQTALYVFENGKFRELLKPGFSLPGECSFVFSTAKDNQKAIVIDLAKGELPNPTPLVRLNIENIPAAKQGEMRVEVKFKIDQNWQMNVEVQDQTTGLNLPWTMQRYLDKPEAERTSK